MRMRVAAAILSGFAFVSIASPADAQRGAPRQSVLEQVRNGDFNETCNRVVNADTSNASGDSGLIDTSANAPASARHGVRVLPPASATNYLREMIGRFRAVQPPPEGVEINVWIQDSPEIAARQRGAGDIYVTRGTLDALTTDERGVRNEQIAADVGFILAHEYAHVLMCHHNRVRSTDQITNAIDTLANIGVAAYYLKELRTQQGPNGAISFGLADEGRFREGVASTMATQTTLKTLNSGLINPAWGRDQERDADWLAVELMNAAGMPSDFVPELLSNLNSAEASFFSEVDSVLGQLPQQIMSNLISAQATGLEVDTGQMLRSLAQRTGRDLLQRYLVRNLGHFHDDPEDRAERVALMLDFIQPGDMSGFSTWAAPTATSFRTAAAREFAGPKLAEEANRLLATNDVTGGCAAATRALTSSANVPSVLVAAANCAIARNESAVAARHFNTLTGLPYAVPQDFVEGSQVWAAARNRNNANRVIETGASRFGADSFYVPRMLMLAAFQDTASITTVRDQCVANARTQKLKNECTATANQITGQAATAQTETPAVATQLQDVGNAVTNVLRNPFNRGN